MRLSVNLRVCTGCGAPLQSESPDLPGFIPETAAARNEPVCQRCFRIRHYGEFSPIHVSETEYEQEVRRVLADPGHVLYVVDVFDLPGSRIPQMGRWLRGKSVWFIANKIDLLPAEVRPDKLWPWLDSEMAKEGITPERHFAISAETGQGVAELERAIAESPEQRWVVLGMANVGKSTLLNRLFHLWMGTSPLTISRQPGTTLGAVAVKVAVEGATRTVIDTPGLVQGRRIVDLLCPRCLKAVVPRSRLRPRVYQLQPGQTLWLGGVARFDFVDGPWQPFVVYVSNDLVVHRTKLEKATEFGARHADDLLRVPCATCRQRLGDLVMHPLIGGAARAPRSMQGALRLPAGTRGGDVVVAGLGWIAQFGRPFTGRLWLPGGMEVQTRPRLI